MTKKIICTLVLLAVLLVSGCQTPKGNTDNPTTTDTVQPSATKIPPTASVIPTNTSTPEPTATPDPFVSLASPISADCGDGVIQIHDNGSFNGPFRPDGFDQFHGHSDFLAPNGCDYLAYQGEFIAPASGTITKYIFDEPDFGPNGKDYGYHLHLQDHTYLQGIEDALIFAGIENPDMSKVSNFVLDFGHVDLVEGEVIKGQSIGDVRGSPGFPPENKFAWQVGFIYDGTEYMFSPTLFVIEGPEWTCAAPATERCQVKPFNYAN